MTEMTDDELQNRITCHIDSCRQRIPEFVKSHYSIAGAIRLNRAAWGTDMWIAPFNVFLGLPNFAVQLLATVVRVIGAKKLAGWLGRCHLGIPTTVQKLLESRLTSDLLSLPEETDAATDRLSHIVASAAQEPVSVYLHTRNVAADITAGTLTAVVGLALISQFTPGSISAGSAFAQIIATEQAVSDFWLGDSLGRIYYNMFPVTPSLTITVSTLLSVMAVLAVISAFSGVIHDPVQKITGIHSRRLHRLLDAIEESVTQSSAKGYRPKDTFFGRIYDVVDWVKALLTL